MAVAHESAAELTGTPAAAVHARGACQCTGRDSEHGEPAAQATPYPQWYWFSVAGSVYRPIGCAAMFFT